MKAFISIVAASIFAASGLQAVASPGDNPDYLIAPDVKLLSAKIENAIAALPETRSQTNIKDATFIVLAKEAVALEIKSAALDSVIEQARSLGDQLVVNALMEIDLGAGETAEASEAPNLQPVRNEDEKKSFRAPPSSVSKGGSDY